MTYFPADPGTWIIDADPDVEPIPIIGWHVVGHFARPVVPMMNYHPVSGQAFRLPGTGAVVDPVWSRTFESEDAWRSKVEAAPYEVGELMYSGGPKPEKPKAPAPTNAEKGVDEDPGLSTDVAATLGWTTKTLKNKSFWQTEAPSAVFLMPGGEVLPDPKTATKITRDNFYELRRTIPEVTVSQELTAVALSGEDESEDLI